MTVGKNDIIYMACWLIISRLAICLEGPLTGDFLNANPFYMLNANHVYAMS